MKLCPRASLKVVQQARNWEIDNYRTTSRKARAGLFSFLWRACSRYISYGHQTSHCWLISIHLDNKSSMKKWLDKMTAHLNNTTQQINVRMLFKGVSVAALAVLTSTLKEGSVGMGSSRSRQIIWFSSLMRVFSRFLIGQKSKKKKKKSQPRLG